MEAGREVNFINLRRLQSELGFSSEALASYLRISKGHFSNCISGRNRFTAIQAVKLNLLISRLMSAESAPAQQKGDAA